MAEAKRDLPAIGVARGTGGQQAETCSSTVMATTAAPGQHGGTLKMSLFDRPVRSVIASRRPLAGMGPDTNITITERRFTPCWRSTPSVGPLRTWATAFSATCEVLYVEKTLRTARSNRPTPGRSGACSAAFPTLSGTSSTFRLETDPQTHDVLRRRPVDVEFRRYGWQTDGWDARQSPHRQALSDFIPRNDRWISVCRPRFESRSLEATSVHNLLLQLRLDWGSFIRSSLMPADPGFAFGICRD